MTPRITRTMIACLAGVRAAEKTGRPMLWAQVERRYQRALGPDGKRWIVPTVDVPREARTTERGLEVLAAYEMRRERECA
jgi:hypothetical protein